MKRFLTIFILAATTWAAQAQTIAVTEGRYHAGDDPSWASPALDDSRWQTLDMRRAASQFGESRCLSCWDIASPRSYGWYRFHFTLPETLRPAKGMPDRITIHIGRVNNFDVTYLNGACIGRCDTFPTDSSGKRVKMNIRQYTLKASDPLLNWGGENVLAVRVYSEDGTGGMTEGGVHITTPTPLDSLHIDFATVESARGNEQCRLSLAYKDKKPLRGNLTVTAKDIETGSVRTLFDGSCTLSKKPKVITTDCNPRRMTRVEATFTDRNSGRQLVKSYYPKYILTPPSPLEPRYNGPTIYGARPGSPIIFKLAVSGEKPMRYSVRGLPQGVTVDESHGVLSGCVKKAGTYYLTVVAENARGRVEQPFTLEIGDRIALTPPMGWNSWNCWGTSVSEEKVRSTAQAFLDKGLVDYGYSYVNIDVAWEAAQRNADGTLGTNDKFPDMKGLADWLHANGLKLGIYSSPGDLTCGDYVGSLGHEQQDAETYAKWGVDYLKYDWCGYQKEYLKSPDRSQAAAMAPFIKMQQCLRTQPRDIFYSISQYGRDRVWEWGRLADINSWRTTGDITDTWASLYNVSFICQAHLAPYCSPGHWNDPDMLIVGKLGWSDKLRETRLTPVEQYTHISLWSLMASNLLMGCDVAQMDDFTLGLLCNNEVIAINQDALGQAANQDIVDGDVQMWTRPLSDGSMAVGLFNVGDTDTEANLSTYLERLGISHVSGLRDVWRQRDLPTTATRFFLPSHGCQLLKLRTE